jgi:hypothetical protein
LAAGLFDGLAYLLSFGFAASVIDYYPGAIPGQAFGNGPANAPREPVTMATLPRSVLVVISSGVWRMRQSIHPGNVRALAVTLTYQA